MENKARSSAPAVFKFYKVMIHYVDSAYGRDHYDTYAVGVDSFQAFADSILDEFGTDCEVSIVDRFSIPINRFYYRLFC